MKWFFIGAVWMLFLIGCEEDDTTAETGETGETDTDADVELASFEVTGWVEDDDGNFVYQIHYSDNLCELYYKQL